MDRPGSNERPSAAAIHARSASIEPPARSMCASEPNPRSNRKCVAFRFDMMYDACSDLLLDRLTTGPRSRFDAMRTAEGHACTHN